MLRLNKPEYHCGACGKGLAIPIRSTVTTDARPIPQDHQTVWLHEQINHFLAVATDYFPELTADDYLTLQLLCEHLGLAIEMLLSSGH